MSQYSHFGICTCRLAYNAALVVNVTNSQLKAKPRMLEYSFSRLFVPWNIHSLDRSFPGPEADLRKKASLATNQEGPLPSPFPSPLLFPPLPSLPFTPHFPPFPSCSLPSLSLPSPPLRSRPPFCG